MFGKKETIEEDFMAYGTGSGHKSSGGFMGKLIQFLTVIILLGAIGLMGLFGYRYIQKNRALEAANTKTPPAQPQPVKQSPAAAQAVTTAEQPHVDPKTGQRLYTQEEMQQIVRMLMEQVKPQLTQPAPQQSVGMQQTTKAQSAETGNVVAAQTAPESGNDADTLLAELQTTEADEVEEVDTPVVKDLKQVEAAKATKTKKDVAVDHYNKVVVNDDANSYDDLAKLSEEIGTIVRDMDKKGKSSDYTASIKKEVATRQSEMRVIIVRKGDSLSKIAKRAYGNAMAFDRILEANPELIKNPNMIYVGQRLRVPMEK